MPNPSQDRTREAQPPTDTSRPELREVDSSSLGVGAQSLDSPQAPLSGLTPPRQTLQIHPTITNYSTVAQAVTGRREGPQFRIGWHHTTAAYTWNEANGTWTTDSVLLGMSRTGMGILNRAITQRGPIDAEIIDAVIRETLLNGCKGPPDTLKEMLSKHPHMRAADGCQSISSPIPVYHASGCSKDVYLFLLLALSDPQHQKCRELAMALKIANRPKGITPQELTYHQALANTPKGRSVVSRVLGWYDLNNYPALSMPGKIVVLEAFHPGPIAGAFLNHAAHLAAATAVTRAALQAFEAAHSLKQNTPHAFVEGAPLTRVRFPSDLNPGNFILGPAGSATLVDCGLYQPPHTFSELMLRLVKTYWQSHHDKGPSTFLDLQPLFRTVEKHFGQPHGQRLLRELEISIGFLRGVPIRDLRSRHPEQPVDAIGQKLAATYAYDEEHGTRCFISSAVTSMRRRYRARMAYLINDHEAQEELLYSKAHRIVFHFTDRELKYLGQMLLSHREQKLLERQSITTHPMKAQAKRADTRRAKTQIVPRSSPSSVWNPSIGIIEKAIYFSPFPDPAVITLGIQTLEIHPEMGSKRIVGADRWRLFQVRALSISGILWNMFSDRKFTEALGRITGGVLQPMFADWARAHHLDRSDQRDQLREHYERWLGVFATLHNMYGAGFMENLAFIQKHRARFVERAHDLMLSKPEYVPNVFAGLFPEIYPAQSGTYQLLPPALKAVREGADQCVTIVSSRRLSESLESIPLFISPARDTSSPS